MLIWNLYSRFFSLLLPAEFVLPITRLQSPASSNVINMKYEAKESEMPRSTRFELVCH